MLRIRSVSRRLSLCVGVLALGVLPMACTDDDGPAQGELERTKRTTTSQTSAPQPPTSQSATAPSSAATPPPAPAAVDCSAEALGANEEPKIVVAHAVVGGRLSEPCFGERDDRLRAAFEDLVAITPSAELANLAVFAGFRDDGAEEQIVAFVNTTSEDGSAFQMTVNLDAYADDPAEAQLTLAHEFAHVVTQVSTQIDRTDEGFASCDTYQASDGCFLPDSLIATWVDSFWTDEMLAALPSDDSPTVADGDRLCSIDPSFLGPYAASNPEEDFAESFAAFVFDVPVDAPELQSKLDWMATKPRLAEFRARAEAAGLTPRNNEFEGCG